MRYRTRRHHITRVLVRVRVRVSVSTYIYYFSEIFLGERLMKERWVRADEGQRECALSWQGVVRGPDVRSCGPLSLYFSYADCK